MAGKSKEKPKKKPKKPPKRKRFQFGSLFGIVNKNERLQLEILEREKNKKI